MSLKKVNLDKLMREESLISEQEEKARALMLKARDRKQRLVRRRARVMMDHLEKVNIDGSNIPFLLDGTAGQRKDDTTGKAWP